MAERIVDKTNPKYIIALRFLNHILTNNDKVVTAKKDRTVKIDGVIKNIFKVYTIDKDLGKTEKFINNEYEEYSLKDLIRTLKI